MRLKKISTPETHVAVASCWPGHSKCKLQLSDRILWDKHKHCYGPEIRRLQFDNRRVTILCDRTYSKVTSMCKLRTVKLAMRRVISARIYPFAQIYLQTFTSTQQQQNRTAIRQWHCHKQKVQQHTCRQTVPAVLQLRAHSSVGKCSSEATIMHRVFQDGYVTIVCANLSIVTRRLDNWHSIPAGGTVLSSASHPDWLYSSIAFLLSERQGLWLYGEAHHSAAPSAINLYIVPPEVLATVWGPSLSSTLYHKNIHSTTIHQPVSLRQAQSAQNTLPCLRLVQRLTLTHVSYTAIPVQMKPTGCPETSVTDYRSALRNIAEEPNSDTYRP